MGDFITPIITHPLFKLTQNLCTLFFVVFTIALVFWTYRDAERRGAIGWFWAFAVLVFNVFGWLIYLVVRPPEFEADAHERELEIRAKELALQRDLPSCPACFKPVRDDFLICPYCMKKLRKPCVECERPLDLKWSVCPYCRTKQ